MSQKETPDEGTITRQRSRASVFQAAYEDAKTTFAGATRRERRQKAREAAKVVQHLHKGEEANG